ncbi:hypothetical protein RHGRI_013660 [Rhododendron griersonianum]|uniref:Proteasome assembly chaperone 2 n=1 Tax=Rhododendron griersonianum TaxID=479676 RepID=A0AAV6K6D2_9ERIC|nr:hypothetical protein RHGRI_013660 [Rhododendron griersonianum]
MEFVVEEGKSLHEECSTLILPGLSIGNVGQLAVDLLVPSTGAERIGYLDDPNLLPCVGNDAYLPSPQGDLALPLEAYDSTSNSLTLIQQRSPVVKGMMIEFAKNVADFAAASGKKHIVLLSSLDFGRWQTIDMSSGLQIYYLSSASVDGTDVDCERLGWKRLQEYNPAQRMWKYLSTLAEGNAELDDDMPSEDELGEEDYCPSLPFAAMFSCFKHRRTARTGNPSRGPDHRPEKRKVEEREGGNGEERKMGKLGGEEMGKRRRGEEGGGGGGPPPPDLDLAKGLKVTCLLCYCSEGDNISEAFQLADAACRLLDIDPNNFHGNAGGKWIVPFSWQTVYGPPPDMSLF